MSDSQQKLNFQLGFLAIRPLEKIPPQDLSEVDLKQTTGGFVLEYPWPLPEDVLPQPYVPFLEELKKISEIIKRHS